MTAQNDIPQRTVYIVSDGTGITAEALARSILSQFDVTYSRIYIPFVDTLKKAQSARLQIQAERERSGVAPIVFSTLVIQELVDEIRLADALHLDVIQPFVEPLISGVLSVHRPKRQGRHRGRPRVLPLGTAIRGWENEDRAPRGCGRPAGCSAHVPLLPDGSEQQRFPQHSSP